MVVGLLRNRPEDRNWLLIFVGLSLWAAGDTYWNAFRWSTGQEAPFPSAADVFYLTKAFGYATQSMPGWKMPYLSLNSSIECVDDTSSKFYNQIVDRSTVSPDWNSSEQMLRPDNLYHWGILVEHNPTATPGAGSCIFMHIWRGPGQPTVGCTAMAQENLESLIGWLNPQSTPLLVQLPRAEYQELREGWRWPAINQEPGSSTNKSGPKSSGKQ